MLNSAQGSEDNKKENKRKACASVFDRSEGTVSPTGGENGYKGENDTEIIRPSLHLNIQPYEIES